MSHKQTDGKRKNLHMQYPKQSGFNKKQIDFRAMHPTINIFDIRRPAWAGSKSYQRGDLVSVFAFMPCKASTS
jgi:hypothetical protein